MVGGGAHPTFCNCDRARAWPSVAEKMWPITTITLLSLDVQHCSSTVQQQQQQPHIRQMARILENTYLHFLLPNCFFPGLGEVLAGLIAHPPPAVHSPAPPDLGTVPLHRTRLRDA